MDEQNCINGVLFEDYYTHFYNLRIILLVSYHFRDKILILFKYWNQIDIKKIINSFTHTSKMVG